jgi:CubicO group peptidase (beta-lactamase class C family)
VNRAEIVRDRIVELADALGFAAHGLHVLGGDTEASHRWTDDIREDVHSIAKGVCVLAAGFAADDGLISPTTTIGSVCRDVELGEGMADVSLRRLLTMTSGVNLPWTPTLLTDWPDLAAEFVRRPSSGAVFHYSNASTYTAMRLLETRVGDVGAYVAKRLFDPLGIHDVVWDRCPRGFVAAGEGLALRTEELARVGRLIRDRGRWNGDQLVAPEWIDAMHSDWVVAGTAPGYAFYALAGWAGPGPAWRLHGAHGQLLIFHGDAVVTITAHDHDGADRFADSVVDLLTEAA